MEKKISRLIFLIHNKTLFKQIYYAKIKRHKLFADFDDAEQYETNYIFNYKFNYENPRSFNEHIVNLKKYYRNDLWRQCADKLGSKEFLEKIELGNYLPKVYGVYSDSSKININELPDKFVLKANHDCGSIFVCNKKTTNFNDVFKKMDKSLTKKYSNNNYEWVYDSIEPKLFAEELLLPFFGSNLVDYKLFCINGVFRFGFVCINRNSDIRFALFDNQFNIIEDCEFIHLFPKKKDIPPKPKKWKEMVEVAEKIGKHFKFVRVDMFYCEGEKIKIGELTFFSHSGHGQFTKKAFDFKFGKFFEDE